jgi:hypothetical protein
VVVVAPGPGGVGTATELGFGALDAIDVIAAAQRDAGRPVFALRVSGTDARPRHRGVSHHARTVLDASAVPAIVAVPRGEVVRGLGAHRVVEVDVPDMAALFAAAEMDVRSMGRGPEDDPSFFRYAGAAGVAAARLVTHGEIR